jgi:hypothetical protein
MNPACSGPVAGYSIKQAKSLICGRSSEVELQLPKLWLSAAIQGVSCSGFREMLSLNPHKPRLSAKPHKVI